MARHNLKSHDIAIAAGVNPVTARRWMKKPGPGYIPIPDDAWQKILIAFGKD
jgi:hypothetical protein